MTRSGYVDPIPTPSAFQTFQRLSPNEGKRDGLNHRHVVCRMPVLPGIQESVLDRRGGAIAADLSGTAVVSRNCKGLIDVRTRRCIGSSQRLLSHLRLHSQVWRCRHSAGDLCVPAAVPGAARAGGRCCSFDPISLKEISNGLSRCNH